MKNSLYILITLLLVSCSTTKITYKEPEIKKKKTYFQKMLLRKQTQLVKWETQKQNNNIKKKVSDV